MASAIQACEYDFGHDDNDDDDRNLNVEDKCDGDDRWYASSGNRFEQMQLAIEIASKRIHKAYTSHRNRFG